MNLLPVVSVLAVAGAADVKMPDSYLLRTVRVLEASRADVPGMKDAAEEAAKRLAGGGKLWVTGSPAMVSELSGRAGGFMMIRPLGKKAAGPNDVVLHFPTGGEDLEASRAGETLVIRFGQRGKAHKGPFLPHRAEAGDLSPSLAVTVPAWLFTGEMIGALTRLGKMPVIYESIGMYDGMARIRQFENGDIPFHKNMNVPASQPGAIADRYVDIVSAMLKRIEKEERSALDRAGEWAGEARTNGRQTFMYSMGHLFPYEIEDTEIGRIFRSGVWNAGFRRSQKPDDKLSEGDVVVHIGYQQPPDVLLLRGRKAKARVVYVALRSSRDYADDPNVIRIDPMWDWPDGCVPLEGYDVPLLPASGVVNGAIAWEMFRLTKQ